MSDKPSGNKPSRALAAGFIRVIGVAFIRMVYRIRTVHPERVPEQGGVLLLPNHVTFADAFFISAACPRPVRFVMDEAFTAKTSIRIFTGIFETMTIRRDQPLEAIREIIKALKQGDAVCLFPEGQLTRTGTLCVLQRGFELIARKAGTHPIIPMWVDGSWGSIFSFERNCFFRKIPHRLDHGITVSFGRAIDPEEINATTLRDGMLTASTAALAGRFSGKGWATRTPKAKNPAAKAFRALDRDTRLRMWANGHQIGMINALPRRQPIHVLAGDPVLTEIPGLFAAFPDLFESPLRLRDAFDGDHDAVWVGGDYLRSHIQTSQITRSIVFYNFGSKVMKPVERAGLCHCPCLAVNGTVIAMSMPHPAPSQDNFETQHGHKPHSWGKPLPGWRFTTRPADGVTHAHGPAAPESGLPLPPKSRFDDEGFLMEK